MIQRMEKGGEKTRNFDLKTIQTESGNKGRQTEKEGETQKDREREIEREMKRGGGRMEKQREKWNLQFRKNYHTFQGH